MKEDYLKNMQNIPKLCQELRELVEERYYRKDGSLKPSGIEGNFCYYPIYHQRFDPIESVVEICDLFGIEYLESNKPTLDWWLPHLKDPRHLIDKGHFDSSLEIVEKTFETSKTR